MDFVQDNPSILLKSSTEIVELIKNGGYLRLVTFFVITLLRCIEVHLISAKTNQEEAKAAKHNNRFLR